MTINLKWIIPKVLILLLPLNLSADVLFEENFDSSPNWTTEDDSTVGPLPSSGGWDFGYTGESWHPNGGKSAAVPGAEPSMKISGDNPDQVFGGVGKAFIASYESSNQYSSDGFLSKDIPPSDEVYVKFDLKFQPGFAASDADGSIKLLRILSYDGSGSRSKFFGGGSYAPIYFFDWASNNFGVRHKHAFRCDAQSSNYYCVAPDLEDMGDPPAGINNGDMSTNFTSHVGGLDPQIPDLVNGGFLPYSSSNPFWHANVYGDVWHKVEFYLKQNSSQGALDGVFKFWLDGRLLVDMKKVPWIGNQGNMNAKWNNVSFGGNGKYSWASEGGFSPAKERWVAFDNILVLDEYPVKPNPPTSTSAD